jgi:NTE family protein
VLLLGSALLLAGCTTPRAYLGDPITQLSPDEGYRASLVLGRRPDDDILFIVSLSGGGMRATAMAYGLLEQLSADTLQVNGSPVRMLDEVDLISAVSGGAVAAAYYTLHGDRVFADFESRFLRTDVDAALKRRILFDPRNWLRLSSSKFSRGDIYAEYFDRRLFQGKTFADLDRSGRRPFLIINATDLALAARFEFTQDTFDVICSDLERYPIARAIAASSAVPALLTPITLTNQAGRCGYQLPTWVALAAVEPDDSRRYFRANVLQHYANPSYAYLHLVDGALSDNLGVRSTLDALADGDDQMNLQKFLAPGKRRKLVFLSLNAGDNHADRISSSPVPPDVFEMLRLIGTVPVDRYSIESKSLLRETLQDWARRLDGDSGENLYFIELDLQTLHDHPRYARLTRIPTTFSAKSADVDDLRCATREMLLASSDYPRLIRDTAASAANRCEQAR